MSSQDGLDDGGKDVAVEADKARRDSELRTNGNHSLEEMDAVEVDDVLPSMEDDNVWADSYGNGHLQRHGPERPELQVPRTPSPTISVTDSGSIPDDTPSGRGSPVSLSIRGSPTARGGISRTASGAIRPFEKRFQSRFSLSPSSSSRAASPAFLNAHSRQSSLSFQIPSVNGDSSEIFQAPWEVVRWVKLRKITGQAFSEVGKRQLGTPTCLAVSASIVIGTSKGLILVFDYNQNLKGIIGQGTKAAEAGPVTSLAVSADYSTVAGGHTTGSIFTWEIAKPAKPFLSIPALTVTDRQNELDGHVADRCVLHLGFLGTRHTALVSADDGGMAFSHLATRGLGAMGRSMKTTRLLGRYPSINAEDDHSRKPSSVLAFSPLPLGNIEQATDTMGITALLTPYLLVIVSTTPIAQTQHKSSRPRDVAAHGAMTGCLAWFPAVRLKAPVHGSDVSQSKLVYCWSDILMVLDVEIGEADPNEKEKQPTLSFQPRSRWKCEEAIVAVQWLSRSVIGVLTISQRLVILEDGDLHVMDSVDLLQKHIFHRDFFSRQLHSVVEQDVNAAEIHGVVADAFYMSFKAYKGRLFLLGFADMSVGTLSNWADRLTALVEHGDDIAAVGLAINYYKGGTGKVSVGLPDDDQSRHDLVRERLIELMTASLRYHLSDDMAEDDRLQELTDQCFDACIAMQELDFLLGEVYDFYVEGNERDMFIDSLEGFIIDGEITSLPPPLVQDVVEHYATTNRDSKLEEILCSIDAHTFDIEQVTRLCKDHLLYDALVYVWNNALSDWVTPLVDLMILVRDQDAVATTLRHSSADVTDVADKAFTYLAFSLTGRSYPRGELLEDAEGIRVRSDLYRFLLSGTTMIWPPGTRTRVSTADDPNNEPAFPYLHLLLNYDTPSFMSMMNEAFEDPFLNSNQDEDYEDGSSPSNGTTSHMTRQHIISVLLEIMTDDYFTSDQITYLDIFIARSLPKYPQFIILSGSDLKKILYRLCESDNDDLRDERELSVEYLLSIYHPAVSEELIEQVHQAGFFRVLKTMYRSAQRYKDLLITFFEDSHGKEDIFRDIAIALRSTTGQQRIAVADLLCTHASDLVFINQMQTVHIFQAMLPERIDDFLKSLAEPRMQFAFLQQLFEPIPDSPGQVRVETSDTTKAELLGRYIELMCDHEPSHLADYISTLDSGDLHLHEVLPMIEKEGIVDAAVLLLQKDGLSREAMNRLLKHLCVLKDAMQGLSASTDGPASDGRPNPAIDGLVLEIEKYVKLGIWLCQGQSRAKAEHVPASQVPRRHLQGISEQDLGLDESLWLELIDIVVQISQNSSMEADFDHADEEPQRMASETNVRSLIQQVFTALLSSTATSKKHSVQETSVRSTTPVTPSVSSTAVQPSSFLPIFRCFLSRVSRSSPTIADLRAVLQDIFAAYAYEADVLHLASQLLDKDAFAEIHEVHEQRQQGWRPRTQVCEKCKRRAWGQGTGEPVFDAWVDSEEKMAKKAHSKRQAMGDQDIGKGKGKIKVDTTAIDEDEQVERYRLQLVVFACKHVYHRHCLDEIGSLAKEESGKYKCPTCVEKPL